MNLHESISSYATSVDSLPQRFVDLKCDCQSDLFHLFSDDTEGGAYVICKSCSRKHDIHNSERYIQELEQNVCNCDSEVFRVCVGVSYYEESDDPRWIYVGCQCPECELAGVYVDWRER